MIKTNFLDFLDKIKSLKNSSEKKNILSIFGELFFKKTNKKIKIKTKQKISFFESLSSLINSWIPITNSLNIMLYQTKDKIVRNIIQSIIKDLNKWRKMEESLKDFPKIFNQFDIYMIKMWELTWKLWNSLEMIRDREEKNADLKWKIIWALIYPSIIITLSVSMIIWFMVFIIPRVQKMYIDAKVNLPTLTQHVINISDFLQKNYVILLAILWFIIFFIRYFKTNEKTKIHYDKLVLNIPLFWWLIRKKILSIFASTLWILLKNWIMINEALEISKKSLENKYYEKRIKEIIESLNEWIPLSELLWIWKIKSWKEDEYFPIELASIVKIWEQTWKLPDLLLKIANKFNKEIDVIVKWLSTAIEPIVIIWVWIIVWTMILAILLPFFNMVNVI